MKNIFPVPITQFPKADIPIERLIAYLSQTETHQTLYMQFEKTVELPEHEHADQIGFILEGKIDLIIDGEKKLYRKDVDIIYRQVLNIQQKSMQDMLILQFLCSQIDTVLKYNEASSRELKKWSLEKTKNPKT